MTRIWTLFLLVAWMVSPVAYSASAEELAAIFRHPEAEAYYASQTNFFKYARLTDLPADLVWENGMDNDAFASPEAQRGGVFHTFLPSYPITLRVLGPDSNSSFRRFLNDDMAVSLVMYHPNTRARIPGLAREWAVSKDKKTAYFRLDPDARFTDGQPISVDDFFFLFFFMQSKYIVAPWYNDYYSREFVSITKYDDYTMAVTIPFPKPDPIYETALVPKPRNHYKDFGANFVKDYDWKFEPNAGPYEVRDEDIDKGNTIALSRVKDWWANDKKFFKGRYNVDRIEFTVIRDTPKAFDIFKTGELDMFGLALPKYWYDKSDSPEFNNGYIQKAVFYNDIPRPTYGIYLNQAVGLLVSRDIRLGVQHSIDWLRVINGFFRGDYERLNTYNQGYGRFTNNKIRARKFDPDKAMEYFAKAGFDHRGRDGILRNAQGQRLSIKFTMSQGEEEQVLAPLLDSARRAGLELVPEALDDATAYRKVMQKNHEMVFWAWGVSGFYPRYWEGFHKTNAVEEVQISADEVRKVRKVQTNNITSSEGEEMSELIDRYRDLTNEDEMETVSHRLQEMIHEEACYVPGYVRNFYRIGYWRWLKFPEGLDVMSSAAPTDYHLFWIDEEVKKETLEAMKNNIRFPPVVQEFDQFRLD